MNINIVVNVIIILILAVGFFLAIRHIRKKGTCGGDCGSCASCPKESKCDIIKGQSEEHDDKKSH